MHTRRRANSGDCSISDFLETQERSSVRGNAHPAKRGNPVVAVANSERREVAEIRRAPGKRYTIPVTELQMAHSSL